MNKADTLKRINNEDIVWLIYIIIAFAALYSNYEEKKYVKNHDIIAFKKEKVTNIWIFITAIIIYLYFFMINTNDLKSQYNKDALYRELASLFFVIGGTIYLILEIKSINTEEVGII